MKLKNWLIPAIGAVALGLLTVPGQAAPTGGVTGDLKIAASENAGVEKAHYRRYRHRHYRHYRHYRPGIHLYFGHRRHYRHHRHYRHW